MTPPEKKYFLCDLEYIKNLLIIFFSRFEAYVDFEHKSNNILNMIFLIKLNEFSVGIFARYPSQVGLFLLNANLNFFEMN